MERPTHNPSPQEVETKTTSEQTSQNRELWAQQKILPQDVFQAFFLATNHLPNHDRDLIGLNAQPNLGSFLASYLNLN